MKFCIVKPKQNEKIYNCPLGASIVSKQLPIYVGKEDGRKWGN